MINNWMATDRAAFEAHCKHGARACFVGHPHAFDDRDTLLATVLGDRLMYLPAEDVHMTPHMAMRGYWEPWVSLWVGRFITKRAGERCGSVNFYDVGACTGYYSILAASVGQSMNANVNVRAFEPNPACLPYLNTNIAVNGLTDSVQVEEIALSDNVVDDFSMVFNPVNFGSMAGYRSVSDAGQIVKVSTEELNAYLTSTGVPVDLLKIDAEGMDYQVVQGGMDSIRTGKVSTILLEHTNPEGLRWALSEGFTVKQVGYDGNGTKANLDGLLQKGECEMLILEWKK